MTALDDFPQLPTGAFAVLIAEVATGIILDANGNRWLGTGHRYFTFDALDAARLFAETHVRSTPAHEGILKNSDGVTIEICRDDGSGLRWIGVSVE